MQSLLNSYRILLELTPMSFFRNFHSEINWDNRLIGILGAKGVGKSTLILQHIKQMDSRDESLYVQADDWYFSSHRLFDLAYDFLKKGGKYLYIDEIHKYRGWSFEIKQIYDQLPLLKVVYSGSSILDLDKGGADLSRRTIEYIMPGLSFREYLNLANGWNLRKATLNEILQGNVDFPFEKERPLKYFKDYQKSGYYPFFMEPEYQLRLRRVIMTSVEQDIPKYAEMSLAAASNLKKLMYVLAQNVPYKPNYSELERDLGISRNLLPDYIEYLAKSKMINVLKEKANGIKILQKVEKLYLNNPNMAYALSEAEPNIGNVRETLFFTWMKEKFNVTASPVSDFEIEGKTFEVGGKNKKKKQIQKVSEGYIVKDDIEYAYENIVPLWMFGFIY